MPNKTSRRPSALTATARITSADTMHPLRRPFETNRHVWTFMLAETLVLLLVMLFPGLSSWIPTYFLG